MPTFQSHSPEIERLIQESEELQKEAERFAGGGSYLQARFKRDEAAALLAKAKRLESAEKPTD